MIIEMMKSLSPINNVWNPIKGSKISTFKIALLVTIFFVLFLIILLSNQLLRPEFKIHVVVKTHDLKPNSETGTRINTILSEFNLQHISRSQIDASSSRNSSQIKHEELKTNSTGDQTEKTQNFDYKQREVESLKENISAINLQEKTEGKFDLSVLENNVKSKNENEEEWLQGDIDKSRDGNYKHSSQELTDKSHGEKYKDTSQENKSHNEKNDDTSQENKSHNEKSEDTSQENKSHDEKKKDLSEENKSHDGNDKESSQGNTNKSQSDNIDNMMFSKLSNIFKVDGVNCSGIFSGNNDSINLGTKMAKVKRTKKLSNDDFINLARNCETFKYTRGYITSHLSKQEKEFPIAFSVLAYKDIEMVDRLLRQIYRPQNFYCLHVDLKADNSFFKAASSIVNCFPNVFMASTRIEAKAGNFSVLEPELICMKDLYSKGKWKYFINLAGQEMPLKTNLELVKILTAYQGANDVQGSMARVIYSRWKEDEIGPPPMYVRPLRGSAHVAVNREFVNYVLHSKTAAKLLEWVKQTEYPEETLFAMLNHNPILKIRGSFRGYPEEDGTNRKPYLVTYRKLRGRKNKCRNNPKGVCIFSTSDLTSLTNRPEMFADSFDLDYDEVVVGCLEEKLVNDTRDGFLGVKKFESGFYNNLGFVVRQVGKPLTRKFMIKKLPI